MSDEYQHITNSNGKVIRPAPHPRGEPLRDKEYYIGDDPRDGLGFMAWPGRTHMVYYTLKDDIHGPRIVAHSCEDWRQAKRTIESREHLILESTPEGVIKKLRSMADALEKQEATEPTPCPEDFQGMPYEGMEVWVIAPDRTPCKVKVTEVGMMSGTMSIVFGLHYKPNGQWFWTEEEAKAYLSQPQAEVHPKNVFLGEKS